MQADDWKDDFIRQLIKLPAAGFKMFTTSLLKAEGFQDVEVHDNKQSSNQVNGDCIYRASLFGLKVHFLSVRKQAITKEHHILPLEKKIKSHRERGLLISTSPIGNKLRAYCQKESKRSIDVVDRNLLCETCRNRGHGLSVSTHAIERVGIDLRDFGPAPEKESSLFVFEPGDKARETYGKAWQCIANELYGQRNGMGERRNLFSEILEIKLFGNRKLFVNSKEKLPQWARKSCYPIKLGKPPHQTWLLNTVLSNEEKCRYLQLIADHAELSFGTGKQIDVGFC